MPHPHVTGAYDWDPQPFYPPQWLDPKLLAGEGAAMVTDENVGTALLFGGEGEHGLTNVTLTVNESTGVWTAVNSTTAPSPRANFSLGVDGSRGIAVLFGGLTSLAGHKAARDTWVYSFVTHTWRNVSGKVAPPARESAAFALDPSGGIGLLEGGSNPTYRSGGSTGSVTWNDTWSLNLTTFTWTLDRLNSGPAPLAGSSMVWATVPGEFLLFGGCAISCSNRFWAYLPGALGWKELGSNGDTPPEARAAATMVWNSNITSALLFGGYTLVAGQVVALNDTYLYDPNTASYNFVAVTQGLPSPRFDAPGTFLAGNGCPGLLLLSGSDALPYRPGDTWFMDANPDVGQGCNTWGGDSVGGSGGGTGNGGPCPPVSNITALVVDARSGKPLPNSTVTVTGACGTTSLLTTSHGYANFTKVAPGNLSVTGQHTGYRPHTVVILLGANTTAQVVLPLLPLPRMILRTFAHTLISRSVPLSNVSINLGYFFLGTTPQVPLGTTNRSGWLNLSFAPVTALNITLSANHTNYSTTTLNARLPVTGTFFANLTLLAYGRFVVEVRAADSLFPLGGARGAITPLDSGAGFGLVPFVTDPTGVASVPLPLGNYSAYSSAPGYVSNSTWLPVFHPWINTSVAWLNLTADYGANLSVRLLDAQTHRAIGGGTVILGANLTRVTSALGWSNFTDVLPPGRYSVIGAATGYATNGTNIDLLLHGHPAPVVLNLTPLAGCSSGASCSGNGSGGLPPFSLLPSGGTTQALLVAFPVLFVLAALGYVAWLRRRADDRPLPGPAPG